MKKMAGETPTSTIKILLFHLFIRYHRCSIEDVQKVFGAFSLCYMELLRQTAHYAMIDIGQLIHEELRAQGRSTKWLAEQCDIHQRKIQRIMKQVSIDTSDLYKICTALGVDFFYHFSHELHFSTPPRKGNGKD